MTPKVEYLRQVTARVQLERESLAKFNAYVRTRRNVEDADYRELDRLNTSIRLIQSEVNELACAGRGEWRSVKQRLDRRLDTIEIPTAPDLVG